MGQTGVKLKAYFDSSEFQAFKENCFEALYSQNSNFLPRTYQLINEIANSTVVPEVFNEHVNNLYTLFNKPLGSLMD